MIAVAVVGKRVSNAVDSDALCANGVRVYEYLMSADLGQFEAALRRYLVATIQLHHDRGGPAIAALQEQTHRLLDLYGGGVLSRDLPSLYKEFIK